MAKKKKAAAEPKRMGRPVGADGPAKVIGVSVPVTLLDGLTALAEKEGWSLSKAITEAVRAFLKRKKRA